MEAKFSLNVKVSSNVSKTMETRKRTISMEKVKNSINEQNVEPSLKKIKFECIDKDSEKDLLQVTGEESGSCPVSSVESIENWENMKISLDDFLPPILPGREEKQDYECSYEDAEEKVEQKRKKKVGKGLSGEKNGGSVTKREDFDELYAHALENSEDYQKLLRTLVKLHAQKIQIVKDMEYLHEAREAVIKDPLAFVKAIQNGENLNLPGPVKVAEIPDIDWDKYAIHPMAQELRPKTRRLARDNTSLDNLDNGNVETLNEAKSGGDKNERVKSQTYNIPWTDEEQRKLEELLIKYPDEPMSSKRFAKISKELGTRNLLQVQSRVQKYFIALKKEGLPVPGKDPKSFLLRTSARKRAYNSHHSSFTKFVRVFDFESKNRESPTPANYERVAMPSILNVEVSDEEDIVEELRYTEGYRELMAFKRARKLKIQEGKTGEIVHHGYKCDGCSMNPIRNTRFHCTDCPQDPGVDFCESCAKHFQSEEHTLKHVLRPVRALHIKDTVDFFLKYST